MFKLLTISY